MTDNWLHIWQNKPRETSSPRTLAHLLALDGYDGFGGITESAWLEYVDRIATQGMVQPTDTIFEVGCGAGAFLYPWHARGHRVDGIDYAGTLIEIARQALPGADIRKGAAANLDTKTHRDFIMAQSVFLYFPDLDYAADVLKKMVMKADKGVAILDVPDLARKKQSLEFRRGRLGAEAYEKKYAGLDHMYYDREWFRDVLRGTPVKIRVEDQYIRGYAHNPYRFNVFIDTVKGAG